MGFMCMSHLGTAPADLTRPVLLPCSPLYQFMSQGSLDISRHCRAKMSGKSSAGLLPILADWLSHTFCRCIRILLTLPCVSHMSCMRMHTHTHERMHVHMSLHAGQKKGWGYPEYFRSAAKKQALLQQLGLGSDATQGIAGELVSGSCVLFPQESIAGGTGAQCLAAFRRMCCLVAQHQPRNLDRSAQP
jgi:hypothetical protein